MTDRLDRPLQILHVLSTVSPRLGGPSNVLGLARALVRQGCDVRVATTDLDEQGQYRPWRKPRRLDVPTDRTVVDQGVRVRYFRADWPTRFGCSWAMAAALRREIKRADLVHIHSLYLFHGLVAAHYCRRYGVPYVMRPHGTLNPYDRTKSRGRKAIYDWLFERRNFEGAAAMHYTAASEAEHAREAGVLTPGFVVGMGFDLDEYRTLPERGLFRATVPNLPDNARLIVFHGRITHKKGFEYLIPALAEIARTVPDVHLMLAGPDDEGYSRVVQGIIEEHGVGNRVHWLGMVTGPRKLQLLRDADVWVLPSRDENFAVAAVEAMAMGAPVVVSDQVGISEIVRERQAGLTVGLDAHQVADALLRLLTDETLSAALSHRARDLALTELSWDSVAARLVGEYERIVSQRRVVPALAAQRRVATP